MNAEPLPIGLIVAVAVGVVILGAVAILVAILIAGSRDGGE